ncbi:MAG: hypothetical protein ACE365_02825 [Gammaproteobacteria bacterium]
MNEERQRKFEEIVEIDNQYRSRVFIPSLPDDPSSMNDFDDFKPQKNEQKFYDRYDDAAYYDVSVQNAKRLLNVDGLDPQNEEHREMFESNLDYMKGSIQDVKNPIHAGKILSSKHINLQVPGILKNALVLIPGTTYLNQGINFFASTAIDFLGNDFQDERTKENAKEWLDLFKRHNIHEIIPDVTNPPFEVPKEVLPVLLLDLYKSLSEENSLSNNDQILRVISNLENAVKDIESQVENKNHELQSELSEMKDNIRDMKEGLKDFSEKLLNYTKRENEKRERNEKIAGMWRDAFGMASKFKEIGVLLDNKGIIELGSGLEIGIQAAFFANTISTALAVESFGLAETLMIGNAGLGLLLIGMQMLGMFGRTPKKDPVIEALSEVYRIIQDNHYEVMQHLNRIEQNQVEIFIRVNQIFYTLELNHHEIMEYLNNNFLNINYKLDRLLRNVKDMKDEGILSELSVLHNAIQTHLSDSDFYSIISPESYFNNVRLLFSYLAEQVTLPNAEYRMGNLNGYYLAKDSNLQDGLQAINAPSVLNDYLSKIPHESLLGLLGVVAASFDNQTIVFEGANFSEKVINVPLWMAVLKDLEQYRMNGRRHDFNDERGNSSNAEAFQRTRSYIRETKSYMLSFHKIRKHIFDALFKEYDDTILELLYQRNGLRDRVISDYSVDRRSEKTFNTQDSIVDFLASNEVEISPADIEGKIIIRVKDHEIDLNSGKTQYDLTSELTQFFDYLKNQPAMKPYFLAESLIGDKLTYKVSILPNFYIAHHGEDCSLAGSASVVVDLNFDGNPIVRFFPGVSQFIDIKDEGDLLTCLGDKERGKVYPNDDPSGAPYREELGLYHRKCKDGKKSSREFHPVAQNKKIIKGIKEKILRNSLLSDESNYFYPGNDSRRFLKLFDAFVDSERFFKKDEVVLRRADCREYWKTCPPNLMSMPYGGSIRSYNVFSEFDRFNVARTNKAIKSRIFSILNELDITNDENNLEYFRGQIYSDLQDEMPSPEIAYKAIFDEFKKQKLQVNDKFISRLKDGGDLQINLHKLDTIYYLLKHFAGLFNLNLDFIENDATTSLQMAASLAAKRSDHVKPAINDALMESNLNVDVPALNDFLKEQEGGSEFVDPNGDKFTFYTQARFLEMLQNVKSYLEQSSYKTEVDLELGDVVREQLFHDIGKELHEEKNDFLQMVDQYEMTKDNNDILKNLHRGELLMNRTEQRIQLYIQNLISKQRLIDSQEAAHCDGFVEECLWQTDDASSIAPLGALGKSFERSFNQWRWPNYSGDFNSQMAFFAVIFHLFKKMYHSIFGFSDFDNKAKEEVCYCSNFGVGFFDVPKQQNDQQSLSANTFNLQIK